MRKTELQIIKLKRKKNKTNIMDILGERAFEEKISHSGHTHRMKTEKDFSYLYLIIYSGGFPGGTVVRSPPANAGDVGSSPGPGGSHML